MPLETITFDIERADARTIRNDRTAGVGGLDESERAAFDLALYDACVVAVGTRTVRVGNRLTGFYPHDGGADTSAITVIDPSQHVAMSEVGFVVADTEVDKVVYIEGAGTDTANVKYCRHLETEDLVGSELRFKS